MKKMLASLLAGALVATCTVPVFAAPGQPQAAAEGAGPDTILLGDASSPYNVTVLSSEEIDLRFGASTMSGENNKVIEFEDPTTSDDNDDNSSMVRMNPGRETALPAMAMTIVTTMRPPRPKGMAPKETVRVRVLLPTPSHLLQRLRLPFLPRPRRHRRLPPPLRRLPLLRPRPRQQLLLLLKQPPKHRPRPIKGLRAT